MITFGRALQGAGAISAVLLALLADLTTDKARTKSIAIMEHHWADFWNIDCTFTHTKYLSRLSKYIYANCNSVINHVSCCYYIPIRYSRNEKIDYPIKKLFLIKFS